MLGANRTASVSAGHDRDCRRRCADHSRSSWGLRHREMKLREAVVLAAAILALVLIAATPAFAVMG